MSNEPTWLHEFEEAVPKAAYGYAINQYSIAYEAWRRGLNVSFENYYSKSKGKHLITYHIYDEENKIKFRYNRSELVSKQAIRTTSSKRKLMTTLSDNGFPIMNSASSNAEKENPGEHYYVYIVGDAAIGAYRKASPYVIGDGEKTVRDLIRESNAIRKKIPSTLNYKISINQQTKDELSKQNYKLPSTPDKGSIIKLRDSEDKAVRQDVIGAMDELSDVLKNSLVEAVNVIPGLVQCEVEVIYDKNTDNYSIVNMKSKPGILNYLFPIHGEASPVPKAIVDYCFPDTKDKYLNDTTFKFFFDYENVHDQLRNNRLSQIVLPKHRYEPNMKAKVIKFNSSIGSKIINKIMKQYFMKFRFDGEVTAHEDDLYKLIIAGNYIDVAFFMDHLNEDERFQHIDDFDYDGGVRIGYTFEQCPGTAELSSGRT